jgi:hypothetical protein
VYCRGVGVDSLDVLSKEQVRSRYDRRMGETGAATAGRIVTGGVRTSTLSNPGVR